MRRGHGHENSRKTTPEAGKAPSIFDKVNLYEIIIKTNNLVERLRDPENEVVMRAVMKIFDRKLNMSKRAIDFTGLGRWYTPDEAYWIGRVRAEADFLRDYLAGVMQIYSDYFRRLGIMLSPAELVDVWTRGIVPSFKVMLQSLVDHFKADCPKDSLSLVQSEISELEKQATRALERGVNEWLEKVAEAVSVKRFSQFKPRVALVGELSQKTEEAGVRPLEIPPGTTWEDVRVSVGEHTLYIEVKAKKVDFTFQEAGFEERRRRKVPDRLWALLRGLAVRGGALPYDDPELDWKVRLHIKQNISQLRKRLKALLPIEGDPFRPTHKTREYRSRFKISTTEGLLFPTPADTTWDKVSIAEVRQDVIRFSVGVETEERFSAPTGPDEELETEVGVGVREGTRDYEYDLRTLGLVVKDGSPDLRGLALLAVLRGQGKVERHSRDQAMLLLSKFLCSFMQIEKPPFEFSENKNLWVATFEASSAIPRYAR
jgi:hypothetical protein